MREKVDGWDADLAQHNADTKMLRGTVPQSREERDFVVAEEDFVCAGASSVRDFIKLDSQRYALIGVLTKIKDSLFFCSAQMQLTSSRKRGCDRLLSLSCLPSGKPRA